MNRRVVTGVVAGVAAAAVAVLLIVRPGEDAQTKAQPKSSASATAYPSVSVTPTPTPSPSVTPTPSPTPTPPPPAPAPAPATPSRYAVGADCAIPADLAGRDLETISSEKVMALTFDAGGSNAGVERIIGTLKSTGTPATFFLTGTFAQKYPGDARAMATGFPIGNHTQTHPDLTKVSDDEVRGEIETARQSILAATGVDPRPYFRFPFGAVNQRVINLVNQQCLVPFRWTTDTLGWKGTSGGMSADGVRQRVISGARPGGVVLFHVGANPNDGSTLDADALPGIISDLTSAGYRLVTLEDLLSAAP